MKLGKRDHCEVTGGATYQRLTSLYCKILRRKKVAPVRGWGRCLTKGCPSRSSGSSLSHAAAAAGLPTLFSQAAAVSA